MKIEGERLNGAIRELRRLDQELAKAQLQREAADRALRERKEHETVQRYLGATSVCMKLGWGDSWSAFFRPWYESGKPRYQGLNEQAAFFIDSPLAAQYGVKFDLERDREAVRHYLEAFDAANQAAVTWSAHASHRADLLREHPELKAVG